jgi:hypothetical protein
MPDYLKLREMVSHRVSFEYDTGARVVGYLTACKPATGPVQLVDLAKADVFDATGRVLEHHEALVLVPNIMIGVKIAEGPRGRDV